MFAADPNGLVLKYMNTLRFKTNLQCGGCVRSATPFLNEAVGEGKWTVDVNSEQKVLEIVDKQVETQTVLNALAEAGFEAEEIH